MKPVNDVICCNHFFKHPISLDIKTYIKNIFEPNNETALIVTDLIKELELYNFNVLHIRNSLEVTENVLNETPLSIKQYKNILKVIEENSSKDCIWFVCSDTYFDKLLFDKKKFRYLSVKPVHSSVHNTLPFEVLCEHFIMRHSNKIIQVTDVHPRHFWGSGYSDSVNWGWDVPILHYDTQGYKKDIYFDKEEGLRIIKR